MTGQILGNVDFSSFLTNGQSNPYSGYANAASSVVNAGLDIYSTIKSYNAKIDEAKAQVAAQKEAKEIAMIQAKYAKDQQTYELAMKQISAAEERAKLAQQQAHEYEMKILELSGKKEEKSNTALYVGLGVAGVAVLGLIGYLALKK